MVAGQEPRELQPPAGRAGPPAAGAGCAQQAGRALGAHVHVVAHLDALRGQREQVDRARTALRTSAQHRAGDVAQEPQPVDGGGRVPAEPGRLARPLVDGGERPGAPRSVVDRQHRRRRPIAVAIGTTVSCSVGRLQPHVAVAQQRGRPLGTSCGPALGHRGGPHRAAQRVADLVPARSRDRSAAAVRSDRPGTSVPAGRDVDEQRHALVEPAHHLGVGRVDRPATRAPYSRSSAADQLRVAAGRDPPVHLLDRHALLAHRVGEQRQPDVHDRDLARAARPRARSHRSSAPPVVTHVTGPRRAAAARHRPAAAAAPSTAASSASASAGTAAPSTGPPRVRRRRCRPGSRTMLAGIQHRTQVHARQPPRPAGLRAGRLVEHRPGDVPTRACPRLLASRTVRPTTT